MNTLKNIPLLRSRDETFRAPPIVLHGVVGRRKVQCGKYSRVSRVRRCVSDGVDAGQKGEPPAPSTNRRAIPLEISHPVRELIAVEDTATLCAIDEGIAELDGGQGTPLENSARRTPPGARPTVLQVIVSLHAWDDFFEILDDISRVPPVH